MFSKIQRIIRRLGTQAAAFGAVAALAILHLYSSMEAHAADAAIGSESVSERLDVGQLDLHDPAVVARVQAWARHAATRVCVQSGHDRAVLNSGFEGCFNDALDSTRTQVARILAVHEANKFALALRYNLPCP